MALTQRGEAVAGKVGEGRQEQEGDGEEGYEQGEQQRPRQEVGLR